MTRRLVVLDRDGVINRDSDAFIKSPSEWLPIPGSLEAIRRLSQDGFTVAVATNQSGIGRGFLDRKSLGAIHRKMRRQVRKVGGTIDRIVYCPHRPDEGCTCRKPAPGLMERLARHYAVPLCGVPVIGDAERDVQAALAVGARPILVLTGKGRDAHRVFVERGASIETYDNLLQAAGVLVAEGPGP